MGKVMARVKLTNGWDLENANRGLVKPEEVRSIEIEALIDTGATQLVLPEEIRALLDLPIQGRRKVRYADGRVASVPWAPVHIEILGRAMVCDALIESAGTPALIGQIPLEGLDLLVDPKTREVRVNPESPDMPLMEILVTSELAGARA